MLEPVRGTPTWRPENQWKHLEFTLALSKRLFFLLHLEHSHRHFSQHIGYAELENIRRIDIFVHATCYIVVTQK